MSKNILSKKCVICGNTFYNLRSDGKRQKYSLKDWNEKAKYCSYECRNNGYVGGISGRYKPELHTGEKIECACGCKTLIDKYDDHQRLKKFVNGHQQVGAIRSDMVEIMKKNQRTFKREKHWNWKGGITDESHRLRNTTEYINWRNEVYKRDHYTCQDCKIKCTSKTIVAHHKKTFKDYPELRHNIDNGITLCRSCHKKLHKEIGEDTQFKKI